jgi:hypothetical protein
VQQQEQQQEQQEAHFEEVHFAIAHLVLHTPARRGDRQQFQQQSASRLL